MTDTHDRWSRLAKRAAASVLMLSAVIVGMAGGAIAFGERSLPIAIVLLTPAFFLARWSLQIWRFQGNLIQGSRRQQLNLVLKVMFGLLLALTGIMFSLALVHARSIYALVSVTSLVIGLSLLKRAEKERRHERWKS